MIQVESLEHRELWALLPTMLSTVSGSGTFAGSATLLATLSENGTPLAGETVAFNLNEGGTVTSAGTATTDVNGVAKLTGVSVSGFDAGTSTGDVLASFAGDSANAPSTASGDLIVGLATPTVFVADAGGDFTGSPFAATTTVDDASGTAGFSLEGVTPTVTYYAGPSVSGTPLAGIRPPSASTPRSPPSPAVRTISGEFERHVHHRPDRADDRCDGLERRL